MSYLLLFCIDLSNSRYKLKKLKFLSFFLLLFFLFGGDAFSQTTDEVVGGQTTSESIEKKYARILGVSEDRLVYLPLYQILDKWPGFIAANPDLIKQSTDGVFAQFLYYLTFDTKIPSDVNLIYNDKKTYLFKNPVYLRSGDLVFYGSTEKKPDRIAVFLQNDILVYPLADGSLEFIPYSEIQQKYSLTAAKIERDE